nr:immunoglobulin heavy chain junction region [Mus musculus]MBK4196405.1 immunoglobulin heavy chain junction region [Mus musculus]MBK4196406.1 immunoglobulin heavy chain junction region [Mus musculus]
CARGGSRDFDVW